MARNKHRSEGPARGYVPGNPATKLEATIAKADAAEERLRQLTREANQSVKDAKNTGDDIVARLADECERNGVDRLIQARIDTWAGAWQDEMGRRLADMEKRFILYDKVMDAQVDRSKRGLEILEQWIARLYAVAGTEKFQAMAKKLVGDDFQGPTGDPFHQVREDSLAFLDDGPARAFRVVVPSTGLAVILDVETGAVHTEPAGDIPADKS